MASKKVTVKVPLKGTNVKKGVNYVKGPAGRPVVVPDDDQAGPGRPTKHDREAFAMKSIEIIQTIGAGPRDMGKVAVAYFDDEFVAHKEGERVRVQKVFRDLVKGKGNEVELKASSARLWLETILLDGPRPAKEVLQLAKLEGFSEWGVRRAKKHLRVKTVKTGGRQRGWGARWMWQRVAI